MNCNLSSGLETLHFPLGYLMASDGRYCGSMKYNTRNPIFKVLKMCRASKQRIDEREGTNKDRQSPFRRLAFAHKVPHDFLAQADENPELTERISSTGCAHAVC